MIPELPKRIWQLMIIGSKCKGYIQVLITGYSYSIWIVWGTCLRFFLLGRSATRLRFEGQVPAESP